MEITRQPTLGLNITNETRAASQGERASACPVAAVPPVAPIKPALEQIQQALGQMPQVDLEKVATIKAALAAGELVADSATLAASMLAFHRGDDR
ncbi:Anti-sigma-28 factor, FlgM [compost metagenome]